MHDIDYDFPVRATPQAVFDAVSTPAGLDRWWTVSSSGAPEMGGEYELGFGADGVWNATVVRCVKDALFELRMGRSDADWRGTLVGFEIASRSAGVTVVTFHHTGWPERNGHFRQSAFCWAMYLRLLKASLETGRVVPYGARLSD